MCAYMCPSHQLAGSYFGSKPLLSSFYSAVSLIPIMLILAFLFWLREPDLWAALYYRRPASLVYEPFRGESHFTYWQCLLLVLANPIIAISHRFLIAAISTFVYATGLIFYALICYFVTCVVAVYD